MAVYLSLIAVLVSGVGASRKAPSRSRSRWRAVIALLIVAQRWGHVVSDALFHRSDQTLVLTIVGITFLVAGLSELVGISAAVGAFLVG